MHEPQFEPRNQTVLFELWPVLPDAGSFSALLPDGASLVAGRAQVRGRHVWFAVTDSRVARGAFSVADCRLLRQLFCRATRLSEPVVLLIQSAGVRVDQGLPALGAFRATCRAAIECRMRGVPLLAFVGHDCFGGASILAALAVQRVFDRMARFSLSGPRVIQAMGGREQLDADDPTAVAALMGAQARIQWHAADIVIDLDASQLRRIISQWMASPARSNYAGLTSQHLRLEARLRDAGIMSETEQSALETMKLHALSAARFHIGALAQIDARKPAYFGLISRHALGALDCWLLADALLDLSERDPGRHVLVILDNPGHSTMRRDEAVMLTEYVVHVAMVMASLRTAGHRVTLLIAGKASGAIYAALAAGADEVIASSAAEVRVLPAQAVARITAHRATTATDLLSSGVADKLLGGT